MDQELFRKIREAESTSCGAAAEFRQGRKPLERNAKMSIAPEGRQRGRGIHRESGGFVITMKRIHETNAVRRAPSPLRGCDASEFTTTKPRFETADSARDL